MRPPKVILCVDNCEQTLSVRKFMLETRGYRVLSARSGHEALSLFDPEEVDLVLTDLLMPEMDGNELCRRIKAISHWTPTIVMSGVVRDAARANHADVFLPKGLCRPIELLDRIKIMIIRKRGPRKMVPVEAVASAQEVVA